MRPARVRLEIQSEAAFVAVAGGAARTFCTQLGGEDQDGDALQLALVEVLNNVIEHAYLSQPEHVIQIELRSLENLLSVRVADAGIALPPGRLGRAALPWVEPNAVDALPEGGFGLGILREVAQEVRYRSQDGTNVLTFTYKLGTAHPWG